MSPRRLTRPRVDPEELFVRTRVYLASLGVVLSASTIAAMVLAAPESLAAAAGNMVRLADPAKPCGTTGALSGSGPLVCTYSTVGSDTFTVPDGVSTVDITLVGAQGGHYFIAGDAAHNGSPAGDITGRPGGHGGQRARAPPGPAPGGGGWGGGGGRGGGGGAGRGAGPGAGTRAPLAGRAGSGASAAPTAACPADRATPAARTAVPLRSMAATDQAAADPPMCGSPPL